MTNISNAIMEEIRSRFAYVDTCPYDGQRVFFENAGGALTLNSVVAASDVYAPVPDNQGRDNAASKILVDVINKSKADTKLFFNASAGQVFVGESGTELIFRLISVMLLAVGKGGNAVGSTLEHPATVSAMTRWSGIAEVEYTQVEHDSVTGSVTAEAYAQVVNSETRVATIIHTSPVTGMSVDVAKIVKSIRTASPECLIIVDGIQHAAHGRIDIDSYDVDGYVISPYKVFSRHGYGLAWISDRMSALPHNSLLNGPAVQWEMGTRDTGAFATFSSVVEYFEWLGSKFTDSLDRRERIVAAGVAIHGQEKALTNALLNGVGNLPGLADIEQVSIIGGVDNPLREGLVSMTIRGQDAAETVSALRAQGIRVHARINDHYSANILRPLRLESCVRVSMCHYNTLDEVAQFLSVIQEVVQPEG
ncbi:MAG: aminotransferase class V-fold PLP-dependent enzyme [Rhizobiaceae bacterium]